jgi:hypothetical protein
MVVGRRAWSVVSDASTDVWAGELVFKCNPLIKEFFFFHKRSRTVILDGSARSRHVSASNGNRSLVFCVYETLAATQTASIPPGANVIIIVISITTRNAVIPLASYSVQFSTLAKASKTYYSTLSSTVYTCFLSSHEGLSSL